LVDRIKLDEQLGDTVETFLRQNGMDNVYRAESMDHLSRILTDTANPHHDRQKVIVTTTHKLALLVRDKVLFARLLYTAAAATKGNPRSPPPCSVSSSSSSSSTSPSCLLSHVAILADEVHRSHNTSTRASIELILQAFSSESKHIAMSMQQQQQKKIVGSFIISLHTRRDLYIESEKDRYIDR
jgi:type I site-specific restriction-modification system R (restriction) subunit